MEQNIIKKIFKNEKMLLLILTFIALLIRLIRINEHYCGLWLDEGLTYLVSSKSFPMGIIKALLEKDYHMPLYYFYVHFWMKFFGYSDIALRFSSVLWGVLTIPAFFYFGKIYQSKQLGWLCSIIASMSPLLIFYSHDLRFYPLLIFCSIISLTFFIKLIKSFSKKDLLIFLFTNFVILYMYTMGIIFVASECLILLIHFYLYNRDNFKTVIKYLCVFFITIIPYFILFISFWAASSKQLIEFFIWSRLCKYTFLITINDWFTPLFTGPFYQNIEFYQSFFKSVPAFLLFLIKTITSFIFVAGFIINIIKNRLSKTTIYLFIILSLFLLVEVIESWMGHLVIATKYTTIIWPIVFIFGCNGLLLIKQKALKTICISTIIIVFICNIFYFKHSFSYLPKINGVLPIVRCIKEQEKGIDNYKKIYVLYPYSCSDIFKLYLKDVNVIHYYFDDIIYNDKTLKARYEFFDKQFVLTTNKKNSLDKLIPYLSNPEPTKETKEFLNSTINKIPNGETFILVSEACTYERYTQKQINYFINLYKTHKITTAEYKVILFYMMRSKMFSDMKKVIDTNPSMEGICQKEIRIYSRAWIWHIYFYKKI